MLSLSQNSGNVTTVTCTCTTHACHATYMYFRIYVLHSQNTNDTTVMVKWRRVAFIDEFFDIIEEVHCRQKGHIGSKKTIQEVNIQSLHCIPAC